MALFKTLSKHVAKGYPLSAVRCGDSHIPFAGQNFEVSHFLTSSEHFTLFILIAVILLRTCVPSRTSSSSSTNFGWKFATLLGSVQCAPFSTLPVPKLSNTCSERVLGYTTGGNLHHFNLSLLSRLGCYRRKSA